MAEYKPSRVALEQEAPTKMLLTPLPKVFGLTPTVQATVSLITNNIPLLQQLLSANYD